MDYTYRTKNNLTLDQVSCKDIMNEVCLRKLNGLMIHSDVSDIFNLLNLHGYKRKHEYRRFVEEKEFMEIKKWIIERHGVIPHQHLENRIEVDPKNVKTLGHREKITKDTKQQIILGIFEELIKWEEGTLIFLNEAYKALEHHGKIADSELICELIEHTDIELKKLKREKIELMDLTFNLEYIFLKQKKIHDKYKEKMKKLNMCTT